MEEIIISVPIKDKGVSINSCRGVATRKLKKNYSFLEAEDHGYVGCEEKDGQNYYNFKFKIQC